MSYRIKINHLKNKLKYSNDLTDNEIYNIKGEIKALETVEQKQNLRNKVHRKYRKMIDENNSSVDKKRYLSNSILNIKNNLENIEENLLGKFSENAIENLKTYDSDIKMFKTNLKKFEKSISM